MFKNFNDSNVIREEDLENDGKNKDGRRDETEGEGESEGGNKSSTKNDSENNKDNAEGIEDIYNSSPEVPKKLSGKDFLRYFKLPLIIFVILITALLFLKYIFTGKPEKTVKKAAKKDTVINDKKMFSPSVFNGNGKSRQPPKTDNSGIKSKRKNGLTKFNAKFKKETDNLNRRIKFNSDGYGGGNGTYGSSRQTVSAAQITKKTVVFIEASYGKSILDEERGVKKDRYLNLKSLKNDGSHLKSVSSEIAVPQGAVINAYTKYKIFSYNTSVPVIAIAVSGYYADGKAVFQKGAEFFGSVSVKHSLNRLNINFDKIIEQSGKSLSIDAAAMMPDGSGGVKGDVHNHYAGNILTSIAQGIVGAASIFVGGGSSVNSSNPYTFQDQVRQNVAENELNDAENGLNGYAQSNQNISITLPAGTPIKIIFLRSLYMNNK
ncbi:MAG: TrbI/VirB10 family protein [Candidatus Acidulodesulfobacterium sp.]